MIVETSANAVALPSWALGLVGASFLILLGIIGFLVKYGVGSFQTALREVSKALNDFKENAPTIFVTQPVFLEAKAALQADIKNAHRRITEHSDEWERVLASHKEDCPARRRKEDRGD